MLPRRHTILLLAVSLLLATGVPAQAETKAFVRGSWQSLLTAHAGRPLAVHFWSLTCAPCLAELPHWQAVAKARPGGMALVLVSTDPPEDIPKLERTLKRAGLDKVESWSFADSFTERLRFEIDRTWQGELPMTRLIAANGAQDSVTGTVTPQALDAWLKPQPR